MSKIASEALIERLVDWGVDTIFGLPGDGINGIMEGLRRNQDKIKFVLVHHEEAAAFMATGYAKSTGRLGVCLATSGPGAIHLLNGLYDAKLDHAPVLAITGMQESQMLGTGYQQEVALQKLFIDVAEYNEMILVPTQIPTLVDIAIRHALTRRGVAHLTIPTDIQIADADANPWSAPAPAVIQPTAPIFLPAPGEPRHEDLVAAADVLNRGSKVVMLVGAGSLGARPEILETAGQLGAPIIKTLPGKAAVPDDHPLCIGGIGLLGTAPAMEAMEGCDTLFMVGTNFPYTKYLPEPGQCKVVQIEADPIRAGNRIATEVPMIGDARQSLAALLPHLTRQEDRAFLTKAQDSMKGWRDKMSAIESIDEDPIQPQYLMKAIDRLADSNAILTSDSGTIATWAARHFTIRDDREFYLSGNLATMAPGLPYTIANQIAHPDRQCIAFVGDGGFAMLMAEFGTACRYGLPIKVVINNNASLGQIMWEQLVLGYPEYGIRFGRQPDFAPWAQACGGLGIRVEKATEVESAIAEAFAFPGPALVDVTVNPDEPPMPGKVQYEQAKGFVKAFLSGQPRKATIASTLFRDKITELRS
ncbi:MAG TPA: thiamine pyrophosphate-dependent enzyme [Acidimicrobiales bacterium]|jgi:pyruvate dehydrogenase (quinone)/pyruvate oxidase|nr:thiamine pyrophosphate-dependent enzyme [Acidimicrobiales bacterium]